MMFNRRFNSIPRNYDWRKCRA